MEVAYVAQTEGCVFLLDGDGVCRAAIPSTDADDAARRAAERCMEAQYVASIDLSVEGLLTADPKSGRQMLFAKVGARGKIALIRTGPLVEMRSLDGPIPAVDAPGEKAEDDEDDEQNEDCSELTAPFSRERPTVSSIEADRGSAPETVPSPRTVRGFPPPPAPIPITSRRGMLPRRA